METSAIEEFSPFWCSVGDSKVRMTWGMVLDALVRYRLTRRSHPDLPTELHKPESAIALAVALAVRQLSINAEVWRVARWWSHAATPARAACPIAG